MVLYCLTVPCYHALRDLSAADPLLVATGAAALVAAVAVLVTRRVAALAVFALLLAGHCSRRWLIAAADARYAAALSQRIALLHRNASQGLAGPCDGLRRSRARPAPCPLS